MRTFTIFSSCILAVTLCMTTTTHAKTPTSKEKSIAFSTPKGKSTPSIPKDKWNMWVKHTNTNYDDYDNYSSKSSNSNNDIKKFSGHQRAILTQYIALTSTKDKKGNRIKPKLDASKIIISIKENCDKSEKNQLKSLSNLSITKQIDFVEKTINVNQTCIIFKTIADSKHFLVADTYAAATNNQDVQYALTILKYAIIRNMLVVK
jgi:hypothetical protein